MKRQIAGVALVVFGCVAVVSAQEQTASIVGVIRDAGGGVVPGAAVTATHASGLTVPIISDSEGRYRFPSLLPGRFELTAEFTGFASVRVESVDLRLGQELHIPITLERAALSETVHVVSESPTIAVTQSARTTSLRSEEIDQLPNSREFQEVMNQVAGANQENDRAWGEFSIDGSSASENRFIVDGVETTDTIYGISNQGNRLLVTDFMAEIQVKSSGYAAEYGGSTGGVINAISKSGSNTWHGEALFFWQGDGLDADPRPTLRLDPLDSGVAEYVTYPKDDYHSLEPGFTLGGPIVRDKLWLFAGYIPYFKPTDRTAPFSDGSTASLQQYLKSHQAMVNVTGQLGPDWRFRTAFNAGRTNEEGVLPRQDGGSDPGADYDESRCAADLVPVREPGLDAAARLLHELPRRILLPRLVQGERLPGRLAEMADVVGRSPRCAGRVPAAPGLPERAHQPGLGPRAAGPAGNPVGQHLLLRRRGTAPAQGRSPTGPSDPGRPGWAHRQHPRSSLGPVLLRAAGRVRLLPCHQQPHPAESGLDPGGRGALDGTSASSSRTPGPSAIV